VTREYRRREIILTEAGGRLTTLDGAEIATTGPIRYTTSWSQAAWPPITGLTALLRQRLPHGS